MDDPLILFFFGTIILFVVLRVPFYMVLANVAGWAALARRYPWHGGVPANAHHLVTGFVGATAYNLLSIAVLPEGLYLAVHIPFRPGHPPLLIPWTAVEAVYQRTEGDPRTRLVLREPHGLSLILPTRRLEGAFGWLPPVQPGSTRGRIGWRVIGLFGVVLLIEAPWLAWFFASSGDLLDVFN